MALRRRAIQVSEMKWTIREVGIQDVLKKHQVRVDDQTRDAILKHVDGYLDGSITGFGVVHGGAEVAERRKARKQIVERNKKTGKKKYRFEEVEATREHVLAACLHTRDDDGNTHDLETDKPIAPYIRITFHEGSQVCVPFRSRAPKPKKTEAPPAE